MHIGCGDVKPLTLRANPRFFMLSGCDRHIAKIQRAFFRPNRWNSNHLGLNNSGRDILNVKQISNKRFKRLFGEKAFRIKDLGGGPDKPLINKDFFSTINDLGALA